MTRTNIVFTMAGKYTRFQAFGHKVPKYLLPLSSGTVLSEVIRNLSSASTNPSIYIIANSADQLFVPIINSILHSLDQVKSELIFIDDTAGQLETAAHVNDFQSPPDANEPICFANIDTVLLNRTDYFECLQKLAGQSIGFLDTFHGSSTEYSYCLSDAAGKVKHLAEKLVISEDACSGLYGFGSLKIFSEAARDLLHKDRASDFSDIYNSMIAKGFDVHSHRADLKSDTIVLGTPEEYIKNIHRF